MVGGCRNMNEIGGQRLPAAPGGLLSASSGAEGYRFDSCRARQGFRAHPHDSVSLPIHVTVSGCRASRPAGQRVSSAPMSRSIVSFCSSLLWCSGHARRRQANASNRTTSRVSRSRIAGYDSAECLAQSRGHGSRGRRRRLTASRPIHGWLSKWITRRCRLPR